MGAYGWQLEVFHKDKNVTAEHEPLVSIEEGKGFRDFFDLQPWSYDSRRLACTIWDENRGCVYEPETKQLSKIGNSDNYPYTAQWAPSRDRLLIAYATGGVLYEHTGAMHGVAQWDIGQYALPHTYWLKHGRFFLYLGRLPPQKKIQLAFYREEDASLTATYDLDPIDVVPYDSAKYAALLRQRHNLIARPHGRYVGTLLDVWSDVRFDQSSNTLFMRVLRPASELYNHENETFCNVEECWMAAEVGDVT